MNTPPDRRQAKTRAKTSADALGGVSRVGLWRYSRPGKLRRCLDAVATEEPLEIRVRGRGIAVTMRTPGHDWELAAGFLASEGIVRDYRDIVGMGPCLRSEVPQNTLNVFLAPRVKLDLKRLTRHVFASSSCGLCGKASIEAIHQRFPPIAVSPTVLLETVLRLPGAMRRAQDNFNQTGALHAAAIFSVKGELVVLREDVGRHNAVDKVIGHGLLIRSFPFASHLLLVSGRASFEILQKALAARIPIICAVGAPSSLAIDFARESGQTLVGFLRDNSLNIYVGPERITSGA